VGLEPADVERLLAARLDNARDVRVTDIEQFARGVSRETWLVRLAGEDVPDAVIVRRDLPGGSVAPSELRDEYEIYRRLGHSDIPVAKALFFEADPTPFMPGPQLYVREFVPGSMDVPGLKDPDSRYDDVRVEASKEHLRKLALVHTCDWKSLGLDEILPAPPSVDQCATHALDGVAAKFAELRDDAYPDITAGLQWLRAHADRSAPRLSLVKGNNGLGEEVWQGTRIVAMSDWELASIGDPAFDFAQLQDLIPTIGPVEDPRWGLGHALAYYQEVSGITIDRGNLHYYRILYAIDKACNGLGGLRMISQGHLGARFAWVGTEVLYRARRTLAEAAGLFGTSGDTQSDHLLMPTSV
jgi:aminoglycoside phosphotransferase (APT) family kinase protein